jgi:hypothetical protein
MASFYEGHARERLMLPHIVSMLSDARLHLVS